MKTKATPFASCQLYLACSSESREGFCNHVDTTCSSMNTCRTCSTFSDNGGKCLQLDYYPNVTISEYGSISRFGSDLAGKVQAEVYARGPVAAGVNANEILTYSGGIIDMPTKSKMIDHIVSIVGWGTDAATGTKYWVVRNSWGEYWGERGFFRIKMGGNQLGIEGNVAWANPAAWTEDNVKCFEDGTNCVNNGVGFTHEDFKREVNFQQSTGLAKKMF